MGTCLALVVYLCTMGNIGGGGGGGGGRQQIGQGKQAR